MAFHRNGTVNTEYQPVIRSIYHLHYTRWLQYFTPDQILVLDGEKFMSNPVPTCQQVEKFLGLHPYIDESHFVFNRKKKFFCKKIRGRSVCMGENKGRKHTKVEQDLLEKLHEFYRPHNDIFFKMVNYTFSWP